MLARSVIRVPLPGRPRWLPSGFVTVDRSGHQLLVLDRMLTCVSHIPVPIGDGHVDASISMDGSLAAFAGLGETVVTAADGAIRWRRASVIKPEGLPQGPAVHLDIAGRLWLYVPDGDHIAVFDALTGDEIDRAELSSSIGAGEFVAHPDGVHLGLRVAQGQDGTNSYWLHLDDGRIVVRELPGETLAGVAPSGVHYLDLPHLDTRLAIRRFVDDHVVAGCEADEIPGFEAAAEDANRRRRSDYGLNDGAGAYLDDDYVLVGVFTDAYHKDQTELHVVLNTRSLRWISTVDYGQYGLPAANSIVSAHDGRWLTFDWRAGIASLWEPDPITHQMQPALFDTP